MARIVHAGVPSAQRFLVDLGHRHDRALHVDRRDPRAARLDEVLGAVECEPRGELRRHHWLSAEPTGSLPFIATRRATSDERRAASARGRAERRARARAAASVRTAPCGGVLGALRANVVDMTTASYQQIVEL